MSKSSSCVHTGPSRTSMRGDKPLKLIPKKLMEVPTPAQCLALCPPPQQINLTRPPFFLQSETQTLRHKPGNSAWPAERTRNRSIFQVFTLETVADCILFNLEKGPKPNPRLLCTRIDVRPSVTGPDDTQINSVFSRKHQKQGAGKGETGLSHNSVQKCVEV